MATAESGDDSRAGDPLKILLGKDNEDRPEGYIRILKVRSDLFRFMSETRGTNIHTRARGATCGVMLQLLMSMYLLDRERTAKTKMGRDGYEHVAMKEKLETPKLPELEVATDMGLVRPPIDWRGLARKFASNTFSKPIAIAALTHPCSSCEYQSRMSTSFSIRIAPTPRNIGRS